MERHNDLDATIGFLEMEERSLDRSRLFAWVFYPIWIILSITQAFCFFLANGKYHPLAKILDGSDENDVDEGKFYKKIHQNNTKDLISWLFFCRMQH